MKTRSRISDRHRAARNCRGVATIEFAICVPVLLFLLLAVGEMGRLLFQYNTLMKAVRDGARYAAAHASANNTTGIVTITPQLANQTRNLVVFGNIAGTGTPMLPRLATTNVVVNNPGNGFVRVVVTGYNFTPVIGNTLPSFGFGNAINLNMPLPATVQMRALL